MIIWGLKGNYFLCETKVHSLLGYSVIMVPFLASSCRDLITSTALREPNSPLFTNLDDNCHVATCDVTINSLELLFALFCASTSLCVGVEEHIAAAPSCSFILLVSVPSNTYNFCIFFISRCCCKKHKTWCINSFLTCFCSVFLLVKFIHNVFFQHWC